VHTQIKFAHQHKIKKIFILLRTRLDEWELNPEFVEILNGEKLQARVLNLKQKISLVSNILGEKIFSLPAKAKVLREYSAEKDGSG
jgi:hypothetical protein